MPYNDIKTQFDAALQSLTTNETSLLTDTEQLKAVNQQIADTITAGQTPSQTDIDLANTLSGNLATTQGNINTAYNDINIQLGDFATLDYKSVMLNLDENIPILLFPVRIETQFYTDPDNSLYQLWVRFFPDDIGIETHEKALAPSEITAGEDYLGIFNNPSSTEKEKLNAWDTLCRRVGHTRAAWVATALADPNYATKYSSWSQQPHTRVMPERFVVSLYSTYDPNNPVPDAEEITNVIPYSVKVGINPNDENSLNKPGEDISSSPELAWMFDFQAAIDIGMGVKIDITQQHYDEGFERVVVVGVKTLSDPNQGGNIVEELIDNHHYVSGLSLLKQGTSTKNTEDKTSGYSSFEFGNDLTNKIERGNPLLQGKITTNEMYKTDGQRLSEALGVNIDKFQHIYNADGYDIKNAMTMNNLLYPATIGYAIEVILEPNLTDVVTIGYSPYDEVRKMFEEYIRARGALSSIRVGTQPYGILPVTSFKNLTQEASEPWKPFLDDYCNQVRAVDPVWVQEASNLKHAGVADVDPQNVFADIIGRHAVSTHYFKRMGVGPGYMWNNLVFNDMPAEANQWYTDQQNAANNFINQFGVNMSPDTFGLNMNFMNDQQHVVQPMVDSLPPSENRTLSTWGEAGLNYIQWMRTCSVADLRDELYLTENPDIPTPLLYTFLRQSLLLEYFRAACNLLEVPPEERKEYEFINFYPEGEPPVGEVPPEEQLPTGTSRWAMFDREFNGTTVGEFMSNPESGFEGMPQAEVLNKMKEGMDTIALLPTAELDLLTREHFDICSFRLDSWKLGAMNQRLNRMRLNSNGTVKNTGTYIGAYGWVENLKKVDREFYAGPELPGSLNESGLIENADNKGYVIAPSQNHAVAAAVLRSGYNAKADSTNPRTHEVNLSSERTRVAMFIFDGIRNGQDISVLLGYEFERALHDRYPNADFPTVELDKYIYPIRNKYRLSAKSNTETNTDAIETVAANNVVDGMALLEAFRASPSGNSIFTQANLNTSFTVSADDVTNLKKEADRLNSIFDAVSDLATAEGIFHIVNGNADAAGSLAASISGNTNPPQAEIVKTPRTSTSLTNRITLNIPVFSPQGAYAASANTAGWPSQNTARSLAEPYINNWLKDYIPNPATIQVGVSYDTGTPQSFKLGIDKLNLQPIDLVYIIPDELANDDTELSQRIKYYVRITDLPASTPRATALDATVDITLDYNITPDANNYSLGQVHALLKYLGKVIKSSRPLKTSDFIAQGTESGITEDYHFNDFHTRVNDARDNLEDVKTGINTQLGNPSFVLSDLATAIAKAAEYGVAQTTPATTFDTPEYRAELIADAEVAVSAITKKIAEADEILQTVYLPSDPDYVAEDVPNYIERLKKCAKVLFGESFNPLPLFKFRASENTVLKSKLMSNTLLDDHTSNPFILDEWQQGVSRVRKKVADFEMMSMLAEGFEDADNFNISTMRKKAFQLPYNGNGTDRWMAVKVNDKENMKNGRVCLAMHLPDVDPLDFNAAMDGYQAGLLIDDWTEEIPHNEETGGITLHFDQPNAKPPQCLIMALPPYFDGSWSWPKLFDTLNEAFDEAKKRGVEYNEIANHPIAQISPALVIATSDGQMTPGLTLIP